MPNLNIEHFIPGTTFIYSIYCSSAFLKCLRASYDNSDTSPLPIEARDFWKRLYDMARQYQREELLQLRNSPLSIKPLNLPPVEEWMG